ncbi:uncharacterized protein [Diabrotica undecimpunctata]|uniref:uncharacterized protein n=1 Tax=Diabrotica undecimpunctata TaxID=50387 RepID=UPI003B6394EA
MEPSTSEEVDTQLKIFENDILSPMESEEFTEVESEQVEIEKIKQYVNEGASTSKGKDIPSISTPIRKNIKNMERKISKKISKGNLKEDAAKSQIMSKDQEYVASLVQFSRELKKMSIRNIWNF